METYVGTYKAEHLFKKDGITIDEAAMKKIKNKIKDEITISRKNNSLYATLSNGSGKNMVLLAQSKTLFLLPDVKRIRTTIEFIVRDGKPVGLYWTQERKSEWKKIND